MLHDVTAVRGAAPRRAPRALPPLDGEQPGMRYGRPRAAPGRKARATCAACAAAGPAHARRRCPRCPPLPRREEEEAAAKPRAAREAASATADISEACRERPTAGAWLCGRRRSLGRNTCSSTAVCSPLPRFSSFSPRRAPSTASTRRRYPCFAFARCPVLPGWLAARALCPGQQTARRCATSEYLNTRLIFLPFKRNASSAVVYTIREALT